MKNIHVVNKNFSIHIYKHFDFEKWNNIFYGERRVDSSKKVFKGIVGLNSY
ncbi:MAG: hypothetical protein FWH29_00110 [Methanobrevibacter sp.]|nr:hypothetical protein [Methanobrevibacter sp.]